MNIITAKITFTVALNNCTKEANNLFCKLTTTCVILISEKNLRSHKLRSEIEKFWGFNLLSDESERKPCKKIIWLQSKCLLSDCEAKRDMVMENNAIRLVYA